ncbi:hypothetical protein Scep_007298 [Stephania cephalantha]|uniref:Uncharacterized protein n=1 Tax=Stephania cephalantha TaxID=152367 RepID=A0AAP0PPW5_9MAGN
MDDDLDDNPRNPTQIPAKPPILRCCAAVVFSLLVLFFYLFFSIALVVALFDFFFISKPTSLPAECKIVSTGVDIRSAKVCELGILNSGSKQGVFSFEKSRFRCRYDYYWASIFKVEYKEHSSGQTFRALAEAPKEALPIDCRPSFDTTWLTKDKFKVNETYDCRYTPGMAKVDIYSDNLFNCQAKGFSSFETMTRYSKLTMGASQVGDSPQVFALFPARDCMAMEGFHNLLLLLPTNPKLPILNVCRAATLNKWRLDNIISLAGGVITVLVGTSLLKLLQMPKFLLRIDSAYKVQLNGACFVVAYFSIMGWLTSQYFKRLGLPEIFSS